LSPVPSQKSKLEQAYRQLTQASDLIAAAHLLKEMGEIIGLPDGHEIAFMLVIGKGIKEPWPRPGQLELDEVLVEDRFPTRG